MSGLLFYLKGHGTCDCDTVILFKACKMVNDCLYIAGQLCEAEREDDQALNLKGLPHNPYNEVVCNDTITATGVFSSKELWKFSKGKGNAPSILLTVPHPLSPAP